MTNFKKIFMPDPVDGEDEKWVEKVKYKSKEIFPLDRFPVKNREILVFSIEQTNSSYIQGFSIGVFEGYVKAEGLKSNKRKFSKVLFWEDSGTLNPKHMEVKIFTKGDHICIGNIWEIDVFGYWGTRVYQNGDTKNGFFKYDEPKKEPCYCGSHEWRLNRGNGAAMYSEDIPNGKRYFCNDGDEDDDFDDLIFTVRRLD